MPPSLPGASRPLRSPTIGLIKKGNSSTRSLPADTTTTRVNIACTRSSSTSKMHDGSASSDNLPHKGARENSEHLPSNPPEDNTKAEATEAQNANGSAGESKDGDQATENKPTATETNAEVPPDNNAEQRSSGWFSWFSRPKSDPDGSSKEDKEKTEMPQAAETEQSNGQHKMDTDQETGDKTPVETNQTPQVGTLSSTRQKRTWLQMLTSSNAAPNEEKASHDAVPAQKTQQPVDKVLEPTAPMNAATTSQCESAENADDTKPTQHTAKSSSSWLFWPRERQAQDTGSGKGQPLEETAANDHSAQPEKGPTAETGETQPSNRKVKKQTKKAVAQGPPNGSAQVESVPLDSQTAPDADLAKASATRKTQLLPNQLLPAVKSTFPAQGRPGLFQQLNRWLYSSNISQPKHVTLARESPRMTKALAIGIHGYFPAPLFRTVLGQPTGTSVKFSDQAAKAIADWADSHGKRCEIEKIALEGEGRIEERLESLWKLLLNWIEHIRTADFIMVACHSQGVPVATMLVAKLISFGCLNSTRLGICAMAGVNLGPFPDYRSRWISGSAGELFDFADPTSDVSREYVAALKTVLDFGVRITYIGSIDDQLVSLESATFASISHPHIYRAAFVDGRIHAPSFLSHLVGFAMKLRNLGISDHGIIRELSTPLAGSLYSGEGHSRLYDDDAVYRLAVEYTLETTPVPDATLETLKHQRSPNANPFILPFAMRGVLEEEYVRHELSEETTALLKQFEEWKPSSKVLKDVKFRLEGIRSKL